MKSATRSAAPATRSLRYAVLSGVMLCATAVSAAAADATPEMVRDAMLRAGAYWAGTVAVKGGYVWEVSTDLSSRRRGESKDLPLTTVWVQDGTPLVGEVFLDCYEATRERLFLDAASETGHCLAWGQLHSGGWTYSIEFDLQRNRHRYHHLENPAPTLQNTTTFDDNTTQSATRFLMRLDRFVDDPLIDAAVQRALECFLKAQYTGGNWDGAWPQRYPPPEKGYGRLPTYNDNTMRDCLRTMYMASQQYRRPEYLDSVNRCLEFYLRSQFAPPQAGWAQQVDEELKPAWARRFEPPAITGGESSGNCNVLLDMYIELGDSRFLDAVGRCVDWYRASRIGGSPERGIWARFYEVGSNKPLYFTKTYELTYEDDDLPVHYSFKSNYGVNDMMTRYESLRKTPRADLLAARDATPAKAENDALRQRLQADVNQAVADLDAQGRWVKRVAKTEQVRDEKGRIGYVTDETHMLEMMYTRTFAARMRLLARYLHAAGKTAQ